MVQGEEMKIGVVNISIGNVGSVLEAFRFLRHDAVAVNDPAMLEGCDLLALAGVGNYSTAMTKLKALGFAAELDRLVKAGNPLLGICLGMQLFADQGLEDGVTEGFGWLPGTVEKINSTRAKIPHMGWNTVNPVQPELFTGIENSTFYFMHSYHFLTANPDDVIATVTYDDTKLVAAVKKDNVYGVQFHPEKSQGDGLRFLKNLLESIA
jgi:glutamine amidotransferase